MTSALGEDLVARDDEGRSIVAMGAIEDRERVDAGRRAVGLPPLVWQRPAPADEPAPRDVPARRREMEAWARRVGGRE